MKQKILDELKKHNYMCYTDLVYIFKDEDQLIKIILQLLKTQIIRKKAYYVCPNCNEKYEINDILCDDVKKCIECEYEFELEENYHIYFFLNT